ncbi:hypothetical protein B0H10DRAFT_2079190 [Mycena sp. CBHHK59/15]|nr:hypothetical protein B0H10DRAFT_2079190 [Mycena sp. CBHHK59/15]
MPQWSTSSANASNPSLPFAHSASGDIGIELATPCTYPSLSLPPTHHTSSTYTYPMRHPSPPHPLALPPSLSVSRQRWQHRGRRRSQPPLPAVAGAPERPSSPQRSVRLAALARGRYRWTGRIDSAVGSCACRCVQPALLGVHTIDTDVFPGHAGEWRGDSAALVSSRTGLARMTQVESERTGRRRLGSARDDPECRRSGAASAAQAQVGGSVKRK